MAATHIVKAGDWIGAIAEAYGFDHWSRIWDHACNAGLRELRGSPDLLLVGDEVQIPDTGETRGIRVRTGQRVVFDVRPRDVLRLKVVGLRSFIAAFGPVSFELEVGGEVIAGTLEDDGQEISVPLRPSASVARLTLLGAATYELSIGGLGPVDARKGAHARLLNLGYRGDFEPGGSREDDGPQLGVGDPIAEAILAFQRRNNLPDTGELDDDTTNAIRVRYDG